MYSVLIPRLTFCIYDQAIDSADGFQNTHQIKQFKSAEFSIDQVNTQT